ncbi:hypothetical protein BCR37DRAFT_386586 [Protomyces lactucae-debilis]|uniref:WSC domain-containing protein n=1 Tax=Protomyces lactucae-debilis TaxID=2754530 RepID=A0A1Y2FKE7_PROLT|nr:uncharacterized protein BCR37DRAFT_386586 [Protomyces lactucae-debilis]ORY84428.1 hypothetical protein BCR37DRAFT_386586 [Protomyces lactucae-debilis]
MRATSFPLLTFLASLAPATIKAQSSSSCYKLDSSLTDQGAYQYQSAGYCLGLCRDAGLAVYAMADGNHCYCGNSLPSTSADSANCNIACVGYPSDNCGGSGYFLVALTGTGTLTGGGTLSGGISSVGGAAASRQPTTPVTQARTSTTVGSPVTITTAVVQGVTVVQTVTARPTAQPSSSSSSSASSQTSNSSQKSSGLSGGAIAGIIVGVLALLAAIGAGIFLWKRKQQRDESSLFSGQEYKRHIEPAAGGTLARQGNGGGSFADTRLDTSLAMRRDSSESFADNQDYSRKILRVVN